VESQIKVTSVSSFIDLIKKEFVSLKGAKDEIELYWFRGEESSEWKTLKPKAYRDIEPAEDQYIFRQAKYIEGNLKSFFNRESTPYLIRKGINRTKWNQYFLMQHYGLRTRLLDWTESALLALFFAVSKKESQKDGRVWILSPFKLNRFTINTICGINNADFIQIPEEVLEKSALVKNNAPEMNELCRRYLLTDFENHENKETSYYPLAILPPLLDERMLVQQSCFTIFGDQVNGLLGYNQDRFLRSVIIDFSSKNEIKNELKWMGITYKSIYPDLSGVCLSIEDEYF